MNGETDSGIDMPKIRTSQKMETQANDVGGGAVGVVCLLPQGQATRK